MTTNKQTELAAVEPDVNHKEARIVAYVLAVIAAALLATIQLHTEPGFENGGWWNEPALGPAFSLTLLAIFSFLAARNYEPHVDENLHFHIMPLLIAAGFLLAVWLIPWIGYALATFLLCLLAATIAGFRGRMFWLSCVGVSAAMVVLFRIMLGIWFPAAKLFKLHPVLEMMGRYL